MIEPQLRPSTPAGASSFISRDNIVYLLLASAMASLTTRQLLSERLAFQVADYNLASPIVELPLYLGLGLVAGLLAYSLKAATRLFGSAFDGQASGALNFLGEVPLFARPALAGLACGVVGLFYPQVVYRQFFVATPQSTFGLQKVTTVVSRLGFFPRSCSSGMQPSTPFSKIHRV